MARQDAVWAVVGGAAALAIYVRTLAPGLVAVFDTPVFQFVGRVLGVPHNPGYPLYVLLTFPFSYLPIGSLAYRINLFSALSAAAAVALTFLAARRLGARTSLAMSAALGLAFGAVFWSQAVIAEVYTLNAALIAAILLLLLVWGETGKPRFFFGAVAILAAGLGNHTTIVGFAPGIAAYVLLKDRRFALSARNVFATALILLAGLLQYGFILLRSRQPGAYVESRATTIGQLVDVMRGRQFGNRLFAFEWNEVLSERLPLLFDRVLVPDLMIPGLLMAAVGAVWLLWRRLPEGALVLGGGLAVFVFTLNYAVVDAQVFLIPTILVLWIAVAVGAEQLVRTIDGARRGAGIVALALLMLPSWQLNKNYRVSDRSHDVSSARAFDGLFNALPDRSMLVREDFLVDRIVAFKLHGERAAAGRRIEAGPRDAGFLERQHEARVNVFAFQRSARSLRQSGLDLDFAPLRVTAGTFEDFIASQPDDAVVALAVPAAHAPRWTAAPGTSSASIGGPADLDPRASLVVIGSRGHGEAVANRNVDLHVVLPSAGESNPRMPEGLEAWSTAGEAGIRQGSRDLVRSSEGAVLAVWNADGELEHTLVMEAADNFLVPVPPGALSVYRLRGRLQGPPVAADSWTDVLAATQSGIMLAQLAGDSALVLYLTSGEPLVPRVVDRSTDRAVVEFTSFGAADRAGLEKSLAADGLEDPRVLAAPFVYRMAARSSRSASIAVAFGGVPTGAVARSTGNNASEAAMLLRVETKGLLDRIDRSSELMVMARNEGAQLVGDGWSAVDSDEVSPFRWTIRPAARLLWPASQPGAAVIRIQGLLETGSPATRVGMIVNGTELPSHPLRQGWSTYEWALPNGLVDEGVNTFVVLTDQLAPPRGDTPPRGIAVTDVQVVYRP